MKITKLTYKAKNWELKDLELGDVNLIVGKNATGKSRTLLTIDFLYKMITQKTSIDWGVQWDVTFKSSKDDVIEFKFNSKHTTKEGVTNEEIVINNETVLKRSHNNAKLKNYVTGEFDDINPPDNKLVIHVNRDVKKYPYLEEIATWAESSYGFKFGNVNPFPINNFRRRRSEFDLFNSVDNMVKAFGSLNKIAIKKVVDDFKSIGYDKVSKVKYEDDVFDNDIIVREEGVDMDIPYNKLSQGMFRALSVLIFLEYLMSLKKTATVVIDDLCEGMDYERATKLGKLIFGKCQENDIQLIATSNDMFLMDVVDIKNWNVLKREGKQVTAINIKNSPDIFKNFKYTGLSNFDFFSSDYIVRKSL